MSARSLAEYERQHEAMPERRESDEWLAEDEARAASHVGTLLGGDIGAPLCSYCHADVHTKPGCPVRATQAGIERERRAEKRNWTRKSFGRRK